MELVRNRVHFVSNTGAIPSTDSAMKVNTERGKCKNFDWTIYLNSLKTDTYGKVLIYTDVIPSTQTFLQDLRVNSINHDGFILTARQQSRGKGRTGNTWLSPLGCMMFSMQIMIPIDSNLGRSLPLIQHLVVVAFVKSIREKIGFEDLDLNIKWPNDIYVNKKIKIGGVIVNSTSFESTFNIIIGLGVNVSNEKPTTCLNHVIEEFMYNNRVKLRLLSIEEALAGTISQIEFLVKLFQVNGVRDFKKIYYKYWLHRYVLMVAVLFINFRWLFFLATLLRKIVIWVSSFE